MDLALRHLVIVAGVALTALAVIFVLQQRRSPQSAAAWVVSMLVLPYVAIPLFVLLGMRRRGSRFPGLPVAQPMPAVEAGPPAPTFVALGMPRPVGGNRLELHETAADARAALYDVTDGAERTLDVLLYILSDDAEGRAFAERLAERARDGVRVRLLLDRLGSFLRPRETLRALEEAGGEVHLYAPFTRAAEHGQMNLRNHRKLVIADGARVWTGGRNVGDPYLARDDWQDLSVTLEGPAVAEQVAVFASTWVGTEADAPAAPQPERGTAVLQTVASGPDVPEDVLHDGLVSAIHAARTRIWVATPYFVPTTALSHALAIAARRGLDVRLMVPERSNHLVADFARGPYLREVDEAGAKVLRFTAGMMHAKAALIDDAAMLGSPNFDVRSMILNFELALFVYDAGTVGAVERWFRRMEARCESGIRPAGVPRRVLEGLFRLGAPQL